MKDDRRIDGMLMLSWLPTLAFGVIRLLVETGGDVSPLTSVETLGHGTAGPVTRDPLKKRRISQVAKFSATVV